MTPFPGIIKYGFLTNAPQTVGTSLGHELVPANAPTGLVFGANAPKPGRASKRRVAGTDSSFYDHTKYAALRADGWSLTFPRRRRGAVGQNSRTVYVTTGGIKYAWRIPNHTWTKVGAAAAALGIQVATASDDDLVFGASIPKPPKAIKVEVGADGTDVISTFVDPSRVDTLPEGWSTSNGERVILGGVAE